MRKPLLFTAKLLAVLSILPINSTETKAASDGTAFTPPGYMVTSSIDDKFILDSSNGLVEPYIAAPMIERYIQKIAPNREKRYSNDLSTEELSQRIAGAAYCYQVDPFVLTALIRKESILYDQFALSPTGAVGYTQFTTIAVKEVSDQLGLRGNGVALKSTIEYLNAGLKSDCLAVNGGYKSFGSKYVPLWKMAPANQYANGTSAQAKTMKFMLDDHPEYGIVYGAILLKVNLSLVKYGTRTGCIKQPAKLEMKDIFREVLMFYNGDHCGIQVKYQRDIMDDFYVGITGKTAI